MVPVPTTTPATMSSQPPVPPPAPVAAQPPATSANLFAQDSGDNNATINQYDDVYIQKQLGQGSYYASFNDNSGETEYYYGDRQSENTVKVSREEADAYKKYQNQYMSNN